MKLTIKTTVLFLLVFTMLPFTSALADNMNVYFRDGVAVINASDVCVEGGTVCLTSVSAGDITAVNTNGPYLSGGASSGAVSLLFNSSALNITINALSNATGNSSWNQSLANNLYASINITEDNSTFNQILTDTMYANLNITAGNLSWNQIIADGLYINLANESNLNVNGSFHWNNLTSYNESQMENVTGGFLNIKESWLTTLWNAIFATKDTDDLTETGTNRYDNQSWNETRANNLYLTGQLSLFFYSDLDSFNSSYTIMNTTINPNLQSDNFPTLGDGDNLLAKRILSTLDLSVLETGAYNQHTTIDYTAGTKDVQLRSDIYILYANGTETQIGSSPVSPVLATSSYQQVIWTGVIDEETVFDDGDYLTMYLYAFVSGGGSAPTLDLIVGSTTAARLDIGINPSDISVLGDNSSFNQILTDTMYANLNDTNTSWTQAYANNLYPSINDTNTSWTQSYANNLYASINDTNTSWTEVYADDLYRESTWDNFTGIPVATPSNGDTTHLSTADQIFDWVTANFLAVMDYTNIALTNITETFDESIIVDDNVTTAMVVFETDATHNIYDNATCTIIKGDTTQFAVC